MPSAGHLLRQLVPAHAASDLRAETPRQALGLLFEPAKKLLELRRDGVPARCVREEVAEQLAGPPEVVRDRRVETPVGCGESSHLCRAQLARTVRLTRAVR